jgi:predicted glycogen debranching enzyme
MTFDQPLEVLRDFDRATAIEWLETNGLGGWAGSTVAGAHTRRYHALLAAASADVPDRSVLVSKLDETIVTANGSFELSCNRFDDVIHPRGFELLTHFAKTPFPVWTYEAGGVSLRKTVTMLHGENSTVVLYEVLAAPAAFTLRLAPFIAGRDSHALLAENTAIDRAQSFVSDVFTMKPYADRARIFIAVPGMSFTSGPDWWRRFRYDIEVERGLDAHEDLYTPGMFEKELRAGDTLAVIVSTDDPAGRDGAALLASERSRRASLHVPATSDAATSEMVRTLTIAADQFIVERGGARTIIAGYHWFTDWGRDSMIALPGLCLTTKRFDDAKEILRRFARAADRGMIPNRFPEGTQKPEYTAVDAGLWFFIAVWRYYEATHDVDLVRDELLPVMLTSIDWLTRGTRFNILVDDDELLHAGAGGVQLTWMDAKVGEWVVTPRRGKPVEVNALWQNALVIASRLCSMTGDGTRAAELHERAQRARASFNDAFWNEEAQCLFDVVCARSNDASIRPNQLFALSLPFPLIDGDRAESILRVCAEKLVTPVGLRTLAPDDPSYQPRLIGDQRARDAAYHQGTVWPWLLGAWITALCRVRGDAGRAQAQMHIDAMRAHLGEAALGTISEIFDGDAPHAPRGCVAQAWSVAEVLRVCVEELQR